MAFRAQEQWLEVNVLYRLHSKLVFKLLTQSFSYLGRQNVLAKWCASFRIGTLFHEEVAAAKFADKVLEWRTAARPLVVRLPLVITSTGQPTLAILLYPIKAPSRVDTYELSDLAMVHYIQSSCQHCWEQGRKRVKCRLTNQRFGWSSVVFSYSGDEVIDDLLLLVEVHHLFLQMWVWW